MKDLKIKEALEELQSKLDSISKERKKLDADWYIDFDAYDKLNVKERNAYTNFGQTMYKQFQV